MKNLGSKEGCTKICRENLENSHKNNWYQANTNVPLKDQLQYSILPMGILLEIISFTRECGLLWEENFNLHQFKMMWTLSMVSKEYI